MCPLGLIVNQVKSPASHGTKPTSGLERPSYNPNEVVHGLAYNKI